MRGTGGSDVPDDDASLAFPRLAGDVADVAAALGEGPIDVLGHSAGCLVAVVFAARHPQLVRRLVLVTPPAAGFADAYADVAKIRRSRADEPWYAEVHALEQELAALTPEERDKVDAGLRPYYYGVWNERTQAHAASTDSQLSPRAAAGFTPKSPDTAVDLAALLPMVTARTLVLVGDHDGLTGLRAGHVIADRMPDARVCEVSGAGHYPWVDQPDAFRAPVEEFLG